MKRLSFIPWAEREGVNLSKTRDQRNKRSIVWSNKLFKMWKSEFYKSYYEKYGTRFREDFPDRQQRAAIYEDIFGVRNSGILLRPFESIPEVERDSRKKIDAILVNMNQWKL